jgi:LysW-gamma-L-lysine carboxypeptidase
MMNAWSEVDLLDQMVRIPSPSGAEDELSAFLADELRGRGMDSWRDEVGNVFGSTGTGDGPTVLMLGHLDTVDDPIPADRTDTRVVGRGAVDAKGPLAAMIGAATRYRDFPGRLVVAGVVEEETPASRGAMHVRNTWQRPDALVIGEPSGWDTVVLGYKGKVDVRYDVHCPPTHPSNPAAKATELAAAFWQSAYAAAGEEPSHAAFGSTGVTLDRMSGDLADASLTISYRIPPGFDVGALLDGLHAAAGSGRVELLNAVTAVRTDRRDPVVRALTAAIRDAGGAPTHKIKTATSDMNTLGEVWQVPMATYGPGDSRLDHSDQEAIPHDDLCRGVQVLTAALRQLATTGVSR